MKIFVGSTSIHKIDAIKEVLREMFSKKNFIVEGVKVASEINEQPIGNKETIQGALNRIKNVKLLIKNYDFIVGIENGVFEENIDGKIKYFDVGWVIIENKNGRQILTVSSGLEFDKKFVEKAKENHFNITAGELISQELGGERTDPQSTLTRNFVSRKDMLKQALKISFSQII